MSSLRDGETYYAGQVLLGRFVLVDEPPSTENGAWLFAQCKACHRKVSYVMVDGWITREDRFLYSHTQSCFQWGWRRLNL